MSKVDDIKNMKRQQRMITPAQALTEEVKGMNEGMNVVLKEETNETRIEDRKIDRKRVSFDLRTDLHKELKMQALVQEKNIYILIEEALERYLREAK